MGIQEATRLCFSEPDEVLCIGKRTQARFCVIEECESGEFHFDHLLPARVVKKNVHNRTAVAQITVSTAMINSIIIALKYFNRKNMEQSIFRNKVHL